MKINVLTLSCLLVVGLFLPVGNLCAQENWVSYSTAIKEQGYAGQKFRLTALVRTEAVTPEATARLWVRVDRDNGVGFFDNMWNSPIQLNEWKEYTIEGTIDSDYSKIAFGVLCEYNGKFFVDDLQLDVQTKDRKWKRVYRNDFETDILDLEQGIQGRNQGINNLYKAAVTTDNAKSGKKNLLISGEGVPEYGLDRKAGKFATVNGIQLYYETYGSGAPLLVLHGNGGSISNAAPHYPELIKKYKVIAVDSRGQGKSTDTDAELTYELMASDINALLEELQIDSTLIWGQSDGAILGLVLALNHPRKVKKVLAFGANIQPDSAAVFPWAVTHLQKLMADKNTAPKERRLSQLMLDHPNIPFTSLSKVSVPVLVMAGDRDVIRPEHTLKLFQSLPKSQLCILPGTTHSASWEQKDLFMQILFDFFDNPFRMPTTESWYQ